MGEHNADSIVDELTHGDPPLLRLRQFIADPRGFEGGRFRGASASVLVEAIVQVVCYIGHGDDGTLEKTRPRTVPEIDVALELPTRIGRYVVESELGRGGLGVVYLARDDQKHRRVAVKVLKRTVARLFERRFYDEAWVAKNLPPHPNLVSLLDVGVDEREGPFLVHEFVEGHDLSDHRMPMDVRAACRCLRELANALAHLHTHRVIHRDLKPSNIRLTSDDVAAAPDDRAVLKVLDLGIAALLAEDVPGGRRTHAGEMLGTLRYMAPEQLQGLPVDERTDVYAFGVVAYELLTGRPPFGRAIGDVSERLRNLYQGPSPEPLAALPNSLRLLIRACLCFERTERPDSFDEVLRALNLEQPPRIALRSREQEWQALLGVFPPPRIDGLNPYKVLHLQRGEVGETWDFENHLPPYVRRDADSELDALLARDEAQFLLLAGPSKCGKSRTAFEALARNAGERVLLVPDRLESVTGVIHGLPRLKESWPQPILWLDNMHEHLRAQSLSSSLLQRALDESVTVVATIWDSELSSLGTLGPLAPAVALDTATQRAAREVVQHANIVRLEGAISADERQRARALYPNLAFDAGLGETFVARRLLLQRFDNGSRELKALVWALADCAHAGLLDGAPLPLLLKLMPFYLERADPGAWIPARRVKRLLERALAQATEPIGVHQRLVLHVGGDTFKVYDPLRYHVEQSAGRSRDLPTELWQAVRGQAVAAALHDDVADDSADASGTVFADTAAFELARRIDPRALSTSTNINWVVAGLTAWESGQHRVAEQAFRAGMRHGNAAAASSLGTLLESRGDREGALRAYQTALELGHPNAAVQLALLRGEQAAIERSGASPDAGALGVTLRESRGVAIIELNGTLTLTGGYQALHAVTHREMDRGAQRFLLHTAAVTSIDAAGVGALVGTLTAATVRGKTLRLCCVPPPIVQTLATHGLIRIFKIFDTEEEGLASFAGGSPA